MRKTMTNEVKQEYKKLKKIYGKKWESISQHEYLTENFIRKFT